MLHHGTYEEDGPVTWGAPAQTGEELWMKEPYEEGVANHFGPESCVAAGNCGCEALTGVRAGWVLSREIMTELQGADAVRACGRQHRKHRHREMLLDPARSKTPCTHGSISRGSREIPRLTSEDGAEVRAVNPQGARRR